MFDIEAKDYEVTIHNFRIVSEYVSLSCIYFQCSYLTTALIVYFQPFLRAAESITVSIWVYDGPFWYEKNNPSVWELVGSPEAYSPGKAIFTEVRVAVLIAYSLVLILDTPKGNTLEDPVPLPLRGGSEYG